MKRTVLRAEVLGFCMGVRRAFKKVRGAVEHPSEGPINTFGPLIHNRQAIEDLENIGVGRIDSPEDFEEGAVVIRAHGVPKQIKEELTRCGATVIDGTCPRVTRSMRLVERYGDDGWHIIIVGDPGHGEVKAVAGYAEHTTVISSPQEAEELEIEGPVLVIAQTTVAEDEYQRIIDVLEKKDLEMEVIDSICSATRQRQDALRELAEKVEAIVVIGGLNSSNTKRLHHLASSFGKPAWHVEVPGQLPEEIRKYRVIGITAGASTPDRVIDEVENYIRELD